MIRLKQILSLITVLHIFFIFFLINHTPSSKKKSSSLVVKTAAYPKRFSPSGRISSKGAVSPAANKQKVSSLPAKKALAANPSKIVPKAGHKAIQQSGKNVTSSGSALKTNSSSISTKHSIKPSSAAKFSSQSAGSKPAFTSQKQEKSSSKQKENTHLNDEPVLEKDLLAKIAENSYPSTHHLPSFSSLESSISWREDSNGESDLAWIKPESEEDVIVSFLYHQLHLPEVGDVKMTVTIKADGSVASLKVIYAESQKNRLYLEKNLPNLKFPINPGEEKTWTLNFCHEL